ncbi:hypothetical protein [Sulfuricurvum sp.]|uniref:hypothetical protein n=1 Tax=Sulfuricurvum sp. TaxID=2025608 RepID=UPI002D42DF59|nr:hypothetical protein [Sulfuricurvum sp.]HZF69384.1 hypothetical protein [Sulfuricurvum sp.]
MTNEDLKKGQEFSIESQKHHKQMRYSGIILIFMITVFSLSLINVAVQHGAH